MYILLYLLCFSLPKIKEWVDKNDKGAAIIPFSGALEAKVYLNRFKYTSLQKRCPVQTINDETKKDFWS
jgi:hypothetical protein